MTQGKNLFLRTLKEEPINKDLNRTVSLRNLNKVISHRENPKENPINEDPREIQDPQ